MKYYLFSSLLVLAIGFSACKKNVIEQPADDSGEYTPMEVGYRWTYAMDSVVYYGTGASTDTFLYWSRHEIVEYQNETDPLYVVDVSIKLDSQSNWKYLRSYGITKNASHIVKTDFDMAEIVLSLPVSNDKTWNGNLFNTQPDALYYITDLDLPSTVNGTTYDSTLTVIQEEQVNLVNSFQGSEQYARHTGLVFKQKERLTNLINPDQIDGYSYTMTLISFDK